MPCINETKTLEGIKTTIEIVHILSKLYRNISSNFHVFSDLVFWHNSSGPEFHSFLLN